MDHELKADLNALRGVRVYFGHQSVGGNILDSLNALSRDAATPLNIASPETVAGLPSFFAESAIGQNSEPDTKCVAFRQQIEKMKGQVDIALMKFCYIDFNIDSQPGDILEHYARAVETIRKQYPSLTLVHVTAPLKSSSSGLKRMVKDLLCRPDPARIANLQRCRFNELLKERYRGEPLFDLAAVESTGPNGRKNSFDLNGQTVFSLAPEYTSDGGHLNDLGGRAVASQFVRVLAQVARQRQGSPVARGSLSALDH
jgi:hypothetical protein